MARIIHSEHGKVSLRAALCLGLLAGCGDGKSAPGVPVGTGDGDGPVTVIDAGAPLDCHASTAQQDADADGFTPEAGDCDDCDPNINPHALDAPNDGIDADCDMHDPTAATPACDADLSGTSVEASDLAQAVGLCRTVSKRSRDYGLIEARVYGANADLTITSPLQVWLPTQFGTILAREGKRLLALSTGVARDLSSTDYTAGCDTFDSSNAGGTWSNAHAAPAGFPKDSKACKTGIASQNAAAYNTITFELTLRAPSNGKALSFDSMFFTQEYPYFVCNQYNDFFVALVDPAPRGHADGNVIFDSEENPIGVNTGLLQACTKQKGVARPIDCSLGPDLLKDTGYGAKESTCVSDVSDFQDVGGAATGWLRTTFEVHGSELITIRFVLWDSGDPLLDSTVLLDHFSWSLDAPAAAAGTVPVTVGP
jgi:hypothetical protein